uniref:Uncharacterized protein n=1 Tax=Anopheles atroparvus TaxID=41427 RepID=A0AAG5D7P7_ANOAO
MDDVGCRRRRRPSPLLLADRQFIMFRPCSRP